MRFWVVWVALAAGAVPAAAQEDGSTKAIDRAVKYLLKEQKENGSILDPALPGYPTATTSLAIMALMAVGHQPADDTREGFALRKALNYVLEPDRQDANGYYGAADISRMYGHGMTTLMLAEVLGMGVDAAQDQVIRDRCQKAVGVILRAQAVKKTDPSHQGGWRYTPDAPDSDLSITVWQVMALCAARNAGLDVPKEAIDAAVAYIKRSYKGTPSTDGKLADPAPICYQPGSVASYSTAAAGLLALQMCGGYDAPEAGGAADWLRVQPVRYEEVWFFYGTYYYAQGMYQRGGVHAEEARRAVEHILVPRQSVDGSWAASMEKYCGRIYSTSMAILSLSVSYHYLPIYQR